MAFEIRLKTARAISSLSQRITAASSRSSGLISRPSARLLFITSVTAARIIGHSRAGFLRCGMTVIISSHILSEIDRIVDDIGIIANGELRYQGELERLHEIDEGKTLEEIFLDMTGKDLSL